MMFLVVVRWRRGVRDVPMRCIKGSCTLVDVKDCEHGFAHVGMPCEALERLEQVCSDTSALPRVCYLQLVAEGEPFVTYQYATGATMPSEKGSSGVVSSVS